MQKLYNYSEDKHVSKKFLHKLFRVEFRDTMGMDSRLRGNDTEAGSKHVVIPAKAGIYAP